ncbi:hypothetical protein [Paracoccus pantotrophus]|nr:hypothetical protein [Paracoccus pantotrophus]SFP09702.1 hypothetical protein SAMN04244567_03792 [Paracoccus pantotrophus]
MAIWTGDGGKAEANSVLGSQRGLSRDAGFCPPVRLRGMNQERMA